MIKIHYIVYSNPNVIQFFRLLSGILKSTVGYLTLPFLVTCHLKDTFFSLTFSTWKGACHVKLGGKGTGVVLNVVPNLCTLNLHILSYTTIT